MSSRLTLLGVVFSFFCVFLGLMVLLALLFFGGIESTADIITALVLLACGVILFFGLEKRVRSLRKGTTLKDMFTRRLYDE